jgi:dipeptidyl aminopeptidase/acylaminoacyl peptidase
MIKAIGAGSSLFMALCLLFVVSAVQADETGGMTLEQIAKLKQVGQIAVSPDGSRIAYTRVVPRDLGREDDGGAWTELHVIDERGESRAYISGQVNVRSIGWLPDSSGISFLDQRSGDDHTTLYKIPVAGGEARSVATVGTGVSGYSFSPDGDRVALIAMEEDPEDLKSQRVEGSVQRVQWSPAGDRLAIKITPREMVDDVLMFNRIRILDPQGEELGRIDNPGKLGRMAWSPDGEHLAFIATESLHDTREGRLMVAGKAGGNWLHLLPNLEGHVWHVAWRDKTSIVFISYEGVGARLGAIQVDGSRGRTLRPAGEPIWDSLSVSDKGEIVMTASAPSHPREAYRLTGQNFQPVRLTESNPWLADVQLARQEVVTYAARDGLKIEGILFYPLDYTEGRRYPLILAVHGGPEAHYSNGWLTSYNLPADVAAGEGYFMFYPNYRGSTGRGVAFTETSSDGPPKRSSTTSSTAWTI